MSARYKFGALLLIVLVAFVLISSRPHWLTRHGRVTCDGHAISGATVYRSQQGEIFVYGADIQPAVISPQSQELGRCNAPAFTPVFGLLFSREADPTVQCTSMWKGAGSNDVIPSHVVTNDHAEFPWGSCPNLRVDY
jgi:hypothetical protein